MKVSVCNVELNTPVTPKLPTKRIKLFGQILTSAEFMEKVEELQKAKQEKAKEKEGKKLQVSQRAVRNTKKRVCYKMIHF